MLACAAAALAAAVSPVQAVETWTVGSGRTVFGFNTPLLTQLGLMITGVEETAPDPDLYEAYMEGPFTSFSMGGATGADFGVLHGAYVPHSLTNAVFHHTGALTVMDVASWEGVELRDFNVEYVQGELSYPRSFLVRGSGGNKVLFFELTDAAVQFEAVDEGLEIWRMNVVIGADLAAALNRPELAGWIIGQAQMEGEARYVAGVSEGEPYEPFFGPGFKDVSLGGLYGLVQYSRVGAAPTGTVGLSMATVSCNLGDVDVPWLAAMQEDHPGIAMGMYRLSSNGRLEQIGTSWMKHGFYALSDNDCTPCQHPSGGEFLGVGCSDTYGAGNNADRSWLGPRREWDAYAGTWECTGSHFSGGQPDCVRRHGSGGHGSLDHRLIVRDADLNVAGAQYFYESIYLIRGDMALNNNYGWRRTQPSLGGGNWSFSDLTSLANGPLVDTWGDMRTRGAAAGDGEVILAVKTTDLGGGQTHYEYSLYNYNSTRQVRTFSIPVGPGALTSNLGFHDPDTLATNNWSPTISSGKLTWSTGTSADPSANPLTYGYLFNFRFDCNVAPGNTQATLGLFMPGFPTSISVATLGPNPAITSVGEAATAVAFRLGQNQPNPVGSGTTIDFALPAAAAAKLEIFDTQGRLVRVLAEGPLEAGAHRATWDGTDADGGRVSPGVYHYRLTAGGFEESRSMIVAP